ncbi:PAS domain S-box protein [Natronococcus sp. JC468]|uniref:bacterio-opsin activator domain-containing protein n=1 Tax=Natronococcus sp. JC468 TaxID=1961921 RepID=UPI001438942D|nr:bacterio-opsin activator domain-containing protein [Natronococcus sp. JC468]NKE36748.1 PAS domain S-box protein [Natronococcus sp. JC468]
MDSARIRDDRRLLVVEAEAASRLADAVCDLESAESRAVASVDAALEALSETGIDCVVAARELEDGTGLELLERIREEDPALPVVLAPETGDESLASDAVAAGVTEYLPRERLAELADAVDRAITAEAAGRADRERARQFESIFADPDAYSWILTPDGRIRRTNPVAREALEATADALEGRSFSRLSWWDGADADPIREAVDRAAAGTIAHRELEVVIDPERDSEPRTLDVTVRPVRDADGGVVSLLARAVDVTERVRLETELRESEQLHRVTLNNMTDTVLITDDEGAFTYVCPNVHFIFGYTDDEIREMGTIDELLGPELFDREELAAEGVLTNIERTATDKAGREHTLLVNVREVSIQGGTVLYSCRDVTARKRREEALTALHGTARELLYAETDREIADRIVADATDVLGLEASAALRFDTDENVLRPVASSPGMDRLHGPLPARRANDDTISGRVFLEGEPRFFADVRESPTLSDPTTALRTAGFVPLGDHGVFLVGSPEVDAVDEVTREVTELLAATAEAALDRVERERRLRDRDRELKRRNRQLTRLNRMNEIIREIDAALVRAETREEIERAVCERLTAAERFAFAWIGTVDAAGDALESAAHDGSARGREYLDSVSLSLTEATEPAARTATTREVTVVSNVVDDLRDEPWRRAALSRDYQSAIAVPLSYDEFAYGVLAVYADRPDAFDDTTRAVLAELGETIASAIAAVERKRALLSDSRTRLEFDVADEEFAFARLARHLDCVLSFDGGVRQHEGTVAVFVTVDGAPAADVAAAAAELVAVENARLIGDEDGSTVLLEFSRPFLAPRLADHGMTLRRLEATPETTRLVVDVPSSVDPAAGTDVVESAFADVELRSKRRVERTAPRDLRADLLERLTDRQLEVVQMAYYGGYFESPRERSGEEIADALGISPAAFYRHVRRVQRTLFSVILEEIGLPSASGVE